MFERKFTLRHVFRNFPELKEEMSPTEEHFGIPWAIGVKHEGISFALHFYCKRAEDAKNPWSVTVDFELRVISVNGKAQLSRKTSYAFENSDGWGWSAFSTWNNMITNQMVDDTVIVECDAFIKKTSGIVQINFSKPREHLTDVILKVGEEQFHVSKVLLSNFSPVFEKMFFGGVSESAQSEIVLKDVDPEKFQSFLETIHGKPSITTENVEGLLKIVNRFNVASVRTLCEEFILQCKEISDKNKFRIADIYGLINLKKHCLKDAKTAATIGALLPANVKDLSHDTLAALLQLAISTSSPNP